MEKDSNPTSANLIRKGTWYFTKLWSPKMGVPSGIAGSSSTNNSNKCLSSGSSQPNLDLLYCRFSPARRQDSQFSYPKERMLLFPSSHIIKRKVCDWPCCYHMPEFNLCSLQRAWLPPSWFIYHRIQERGR